jgi:hypothetical protein
MSTHLRDAKAHTILASIFISGLVLARILQSGKDKNSDQYKEYNVIQAATGGFFLAATISSWRATSEAKEELVQAVEAFNENSPHKIEPAPQGKQETDNLFPTRP